MHIVDVVLQHCMCIIKRQMVYHGNGLSWRGPIVARLGRNPLPGTQTVPCNNTYQHQAWMAYLPRIMTFMQFTLELYTAFQFAIQWGFSSLCHCE